MLSILFLTLEDTFRILTWVICNLSFLSPFLNVQKQVRRPFIGSLIQFPQFGKWSLAGLDEGLTRLSQRLGVEAPGGGFWRDTGGGRRLSEQRYRCGRKGGQEIFTDSEVEELLQSGSQHGRTVCNSAWCVCMLT